MNWTIAGSRAHTGIAPARLRRPQRLRRQGTGRRSAAGLVSSCRGGVDVGEPPLELAVVGARPLDVEQVAGLADAVQEALVAELPAIWFGRSRLALIGSTKHDRQQLSLGGAYSFIFLASSMSKILSSSPHSSMIFCNHGRHFNPFFFGMVHMEPNQVGLLSRKRSGWGPR